MGEEWPEWEAVTDEQDRRYSSVLNGETKRLKVPGGWIYRNMWQGHGHEPVVAMCFVPDPRNSPYEQ
jgi:hypothetical protein